MLATDFSHSSDFQEPRNLWEAMGRLAQIQEQQSFAQRGGDLAQVARLQSLQAVIWAYVKTFAAQLVERGEAPSDMVERLRSSLHIDSARDRELSAAHHHLSSEEERLAA